MTANPETVKVALHVLCVPAMEISPIVFMRRGSWESRLSRE